MQVFAFTRMKCLTFSSLALISWLSVFTCKVNAQEATELEAQRARFVELEKQLGRASRKKVAQLEDEVAALSSYPLYPYLLRQQIDQRMDMAHRDDIEAFLLNYHNQPFTYGLRGRWLRYLAKHNEKKAFLANYRDGMGTTITCQYLQYQLEDAVQPEYWLAKVAPLWLSGESQPDECDPVFRRWQKAGMLTDELILGRIEKAALAGNPKLIPYLKGKLPASKRYLADLWQQIRTASTLVLKKSRFPLKDKQTESRVLAYGMEKLGWQDTDAAIKAWYLWQPYNVLSKQQYLDVSRAIALSLAIDDKPEADEWLKRADIDGADDDVKRWHMSYLLRHERWQDVLDLVAQSPDVVQQDDAFRYWQARSLEALGLPEQAEERYRELADERNYYGFMASARVNQQPSLRHAETPRNDETVSMIANRPAAKRAKEFLALGRLIDARREWHYMVTSLETSQVKDAALLANEWGWFDQAIISFTQSGFLDDVEKRFPMAYADRFNDVGRAFDIQPAFAMAIARRESSFMADAISPTGARGLMQLMPGTARYIAEKNVSSDELFDADQNVQFGVQYLRYLMDKMGDNPVLVSASYNAGWRRVMKWLPAGKTMETDIWIETIPYKETRNYVKAVMAYRYIYEHQLGETSGIFEQLARSAIPPAGGLSGPGSASGSTFAPK